MKYVVKIKLREIFLSFPCSYQRIILKFLSWPLRLIFLYVQWFWKSDKKKKKVSCMQHILYMCEYLDIYRGTEKFLAKPRMEWPLDFIDFLFGWVQQNWEIMFQVYWTEV